MTGLRQSPQYGKYMKTIGWKVVVANKTNIFIKKLPLLPFSIIKVQRPQKIPFKKIDQLAKKYRAFAIYLEPSTINNQQLAINRGYHLSKSPFLPTKTIQLDLTQPEEKILAQMKKDGRYGIRKAKDSKIKILKTEGKGKKPGQKNETLKLFHQAWKKSVGWRRYVPSLESLEKLKTSFGKKAIFLTTVTYHTTLYDILAGTIILIANKTVYYYYAFTSKEGRKKSAQYLLVWEAIKSAKKRGCKIFDFEGIYDPRFPIKTWKGFSHFKKSFGGKEVNYPGCFVKYRLPLI